MLGECLLSHIISGYTLYQCPTKHFLHVPVVTYTLSVISEPMSISLFPDCTALKLTVAQSTYGGST